jgi:transcriptional regulator with XRE-family HTH domain
MADRKQRARAEVRSAQAEFERAQSQRDQASASRRKSFERAQAAGLTVRDIAEETGLHFSRIAQILRGE